MQAQKERMMVDMQCNAMLVVVYKEGGAKWKASEMCHFACIRCNPHPPRTPLFACTVVGQSHSLHLHLFHIHLYSDYEVAVRFNFENIPTNICTKSH
jgi:hypothetical protein